MRILIVGGAGRVGTWLTGALRGAHQVTVLDRSIPQEGVPADVHCREAPATDTAALAEAVQGQDLVVHLAGVTPRAGWADSPARIADAFATNVGSLAATLEMCALHGVKRIVHISTVSVFHAFGESPVDPEGPSDSFEPYGLSKRTGEWIARKYAEQRDLHVTSMRLVFPTADEDAPAWRHPGDGSLRHPVLADGTAIPATPASLIARHIVEASRWEGRYRAVVVAPTSNGLIRPPHLD